VPYEHGTRQPHSGTGPLHHGRLDQACVENAGCIGLIIGLIDWEINGPGGSVYDIAILVMPLALSTSLSTSDDGVDVVVDEPDGGPGVTSQQPCHGSEVRDTYTPHSGAMPNVELTTSSTGS
jgi:hypothetical protein